ncbi:MAG: hypothetical protein H0U49_01610, partial [Parachlamydiaceae bacterium]|nr:hypothetical protein [Parachlamydiaceae bacterium]
LSAFMITFSIFFVPLTNLQSELIFDGNGGRYSISSDRSYLMIESSIPSLDFSEIYPDLDTIVINVSNYSPYYYNLAKDDYGLSNNVNVTNLKIAGAPSQNLLPWAHMPNVKTFAVSSPSNNLYYLEFALPFIESLEIILYREQAEFVKTLENISKLINLEDFKLQMDGAWRTQGFTNYELCALSKMHKLKKLTIIFTNLNYGDQGFSEAKLEELKHILPNTDVQVESYFRQSQDGGS